MVLIKIDAHTRWYSELQREETNTPGSLLGDCSILTDVSGMYDKVMYRTLIGNQLRTFLARRTPTAYLKGIGAGGGIGGRDSHHTWN